MYSVIGLPKKPAGVGTEEWTSLASLSMSSRSWLSIMCTEDSGSGVATSCTHAHELLECRNAYYLGDRCPTT